MVKNGSAVAKSGKVTKRILITQPKPENDKSPYYELARKHNVALVFHPFIRLEGIPSKEFRRQKIDITQYTAAIFTSRNAIDHFFRVCDEMKINISQDMKYFCTSEAVALYLQKFILYRKRKVFYGADGANKNMFDVINKHKENEKFLYVCSENQQDNEIVSWLKANKCGFALAFMYRTISNDIATVMSASYDVICFFTPSGVKSLFDNMPAYQQQKTMIGAFGNNTGKAVEDSGLSLLIKAPAPHAPSMVAALEKYLAAPNATASEASELKATVINTTPVKVTSLKTIAPKTKAQKPTVSKITASKKAALKPTDTKVTATKRVSLKIKVSKPAVPKTTVPKTTATKRASLKATVSKRVVLKRTVPKVTAKKKASLKATVSKTVVLKRTVPKTTVKKKASLKAIVSKTVVLKPAVSKAKATTSKRTSLKASASKRAVLKPTVSKVIATKRSSLKATTSKTLVLKPTVSKATMLKAKPTVKKRKAAR